MRRRRWTVRCLQRCSGCWEPSVGVVVGVWALACLNVDGFAKEGLDLARCLSREKMWHTPTTHFSSTSITRTERCSMVKFKI